jgi:hypothetical protein
MNATPMLLRSGAWGVRVQGIVKPGAVVTVTTKGGKSWSAMIERVLWSGDGMSICATRRQTAKACTSQRDSADGRCDDCIDNGDCGDMQGCSRHRGSPRF